MARQSTNPEKHEDISADEIILSRVGPINHLRFSALAGRVTVLVGPNGSGKSQALDAVDALAHDGIRLANSDGVTDGFARGFGRTITVGKSGQNRRSGDVDVEALEERLSLADLVDPGVKDPGAADLRRLKALVQLSGRTASTELFGGILPGGQDEWKSLCREESLSCDDVVQMGERIKRDLEQAARTKENEAENLKTEATGKRDANEGIDLTAPSDRGELQRNVNAAYQEWERLQQQRSNGLEAIENARNAREKLAEHTGSGTTPLQAQARVDDAQEQRDKAQSKVDDLERQLEQAKAERDARDRDLEHAQELRDAAQQNADAVAGWQESIDNAPSLDDLPSEDQVSAAEQRYNEALVAQEYGTRVRDAMDRERKAKEKDEQAKQARNRAAQLRDAAWATAECLSEIVKQMGTVFRIDNEFRLRVPHERREGQECYFAELSPGEKWSVAIDTLLQQIETTGLDRTAVLRIPQEAWEGLDHTNRCHVAEQIKGKPVAIITASPSIRIACPNCLMEVPVDRATCEYCEADLPVEHNIGVTYFEAPK